MQERGKSEGERKRRKGIKSKELVPLGYLLFEREREAARGKRMRAFTAGARAPVPNSPLIYPTSFRSDR